MAYTKPTGVNSLWAASGDKTTVPSAKVSAGWVAEKPSYQYFNQILYNLGLYDAYANERGIVEWDSGTEYQAEKSYIVGSDGNLYKCLVTGDGIDPTLDDGTNWQLILSSNGIAGWSAVVSYPEGAVVLYSDGDLYEATTTTTVGSVPGVSSDWWAYERNGDLRTLIDNNTQQLFTIMTAVSTNGAAIDTLENLVNKSVTVDFSSDADLTLTTAQNEYGRIAITDSGSVLTSERELIVGDTERFLTVKNETDYAIKVVTASGTGVHVEVGEQFSLRVDGVNVLSNGVDNTIEIAPFGSYNSGTLTYPFALSQTDFHKFRIYAGRSTFSNQIRGYLEFLYDAIDNNPTSWNANVAMSSSATSIDLSISYSSGTSVALTSAGGDSDLKSMYATLKDGVTY